jgi:predicted nuclease of restriction endonuclease-like (RecB) superfamily
MEPQRAAEPDQSRRVRTITERRQDSQFGRQHRLTLGRKDYFVDLLFYHRFLRR